MTTTPATEVDTRDMLVVHDSIRRQFGQAPPLIRDVAPGDTDRAAVVADHLELLGALLHHHHVGEDRLLWPVLQPRVSPDAAATVARMETQHDGVAEAQPPSPPPSPPGARRPARPNGRRWPRPGSRWSAGSSSTSTPRSGTSSRWRPRT